MRRLFPAVLVYALWSPVQGATLPGNPPPESPAAGDPSVVKTDTQSHLAFDLPQAIITAQGGQPAAPPSTPWLNPGGPQANLLNQLLSGGETDQEVVDPEQAFKVYLLVGDSQTLIARFQIDDCCYLYRDKTRFELDGSPDGVHLGGYTLPAGERKHDEFFGETEVYHHGFEVPLALEGGSGLKGERVLTAHYQGCAEKGVAICYPPATKKFVLNLTAAGIAGIAALDTAPPLGGIRQPRSLTGLILTLLTAFGAGLALTFTACVLPMLPILSSIIAGQDTTTVSKLRGGVLSLTYVAGTSVTYTVAGMVAGATGAQLQAYFQNIWAIGFLSLILVAMALAMFGVYELQLPAAIRSRLQHRAQKLKGGTFAGVFALGLVSALIVGACVSPVLATALAGAISSQDPLLGGTIMFALSWGMGVILIAIGFGGGWFLPKAGPWMDRIHQAFGVLLLGVVIYFLGYLPQVPVLYLWAGLFIVTAVYLGATQPLPKEVTGWRYLWKGVGTLMFVWGILALIGAFAGNRDILRPLPLAGSGSGILIGTDNATPGREARAAASSVNGFERTVTLRQLETRLAAAKAAGQPVIVDYYASWCLDCKRMEELTFSDPRVRRALRRFVLLQADVSNPFDPQAQALQRRFQVYGPPRTLFFSTAGEELQSLHFYGFMGAEEFLQILNRIELRV